MLDRPFRGAEAVARGLVTPAQLRGPRYVALFRGVHLATPPRPPGLGIRSRAACLLLGDEGALAGYSAAELLGAGFAPEHAPAEIVAPGTGIRARPGLLVHRGALPATDVCVAAGCRVTTPLRTAWDLARRLERTEAVVAVDALARRGRFDPARLLAHRPGARGCRRLAEIGGLSNPLAESPMETRLRMLLHEYGLPVPAVQHEVLDAYGFVVARCDLAYPQVRLAIEYDGEEFHRGRRVRDNHRDIALAELGWETMRVGAADVWTTPRRTADSVQRLLTARTRPR